MKMKNEAEFKAIGKKMPYKTPPGFFDRISEETLQKAKQKEMEQRKIRRLWRTVSVAASIAAIVFLGYVMLEPESRQKSNLLVQRMKQSGLRIMKSKRNQVQTPKDTGIRYLIPSDQGDNATDAEVISDALADMSYDELSQMAAMFQTDPFLNEMVQ